MTHKFCNIGDILNIHYLNILLKEYNITVFDRSDVSFSIDRVSYGLDDKIIDITSQTLSRFYNNNKFLGIINYNDNFSFENEFEI